MLLLQHKLKKSVKYQYAILETIWRLIYTLQLSPMRSAFKVGTALVVQNRKKVEKRPQGFKMYFCRNQSPTESQSAQLSLNSLTFARLGKWQSVCSNWQVMSSNVKFLMLFRRIPESSSFIVFIVFSLLFLVWFPLFLLVVVHLYHLFEKSLAIFMFS